jgi:hypothetical protein
MDVKITAPPGTTCGQRWEASPFSLSRVVSGWSSPPAAGTVKRPLPFSGARTMVLFGPQLAPRLRLTLHSVIGVPPVIGTFLRCSVVAKPTHWPSGEKKGW